MGPKRLGIAATVAFGAAGIVAAHAIDYLLVFRDPTQRAHVLMQTGHAAFPSVVGSFLVGAVIGGVLALAVGWATPERGERLRFWGTAWRLASLQTVGFVLMEVTERLQVGLPAHHMWSSALPAGVALQVLTALFAALVIVLLARAGHALARARRRRPTVVPIARPWTPRIAHLVPILAREPYAPRAPPLVAVS